MASEFQLLAVTNSPNELMTRMIDLAGQRYGRLTVLRRAPNKGKDTAWLCRCDCGTEIDVRAHGLRSANTQSCGCLRQELKTSHGMARSPEYRAWQDLNQRCSNPKCQRWDRYGGRGIECRFTGFEQFLAEIGPRPSPRHSVDRIDNEGHYEPGNVQWALSKPQQRNLSTNHLLTFDGRTQCVSAWAEERGMGRDALWGRLRRGWSVERALAEPVKRSS